MKWGMTQLHNWFYFTLSFSSSTPWKTSCFFPSQHVGFSHHSLFQDWIGLEPTMTLVENAWNPGFETVKIFGERLGKPRIEVVDIPMKTSCCWEKSGVFEWFRSFQPIFYQVGWGKPIGNQKPIRNPSGTWSGTRRKPVGNSSETRRKHLHGPSNQDLLRYRRRKPVGNIWRANPSRVRYGSAT